MGFRSLRYSLEYNRVERVSKLVDSTIARLTVCGFSLTFLSSTVGFKSLTARVSPEVLDAMRLLVQAVMGGMENRWVRGATLVGEVFSAS